MNERVGPLEGIRVAQAVTNGTANGPRKVVVQKPSDGQSVTIDVRGGAEIDLKAIAGERVVFVQAGDRLIILFENREAVVLTGVYRDGQVAEGLTFDVGQLQPLNPQQFAGLFPISSDLSILPAAGPASPSGTNGAAKNTIDPAFDATGFGRSGLGLLGDSQDGEQAPGDSDGANGRPQLGPGQIFFSDEDGDGFLEGNPGGPDDSDAPRVVNGQIQYSFGSDGPAAFGAVILNANSLPTDVTSLGLPVTYLVENGGLTIRAVVQVPNGEGDPTTETVFTFQITNFLTGTFTFTLLRPLDHEAPVQGEDGVPVSFENELLFNIGITLTDSNGDQASGTFRMSIDDDTPEIGNAIEGEGGLTYDGQGETRWVEEEDAGDKSAPGPGGNDENADFENDGETDLSNTVSGSLNIRWGADRGDDVNETDEGNEEFTVGDRNVRFADSSVGVEGAYPRASNDGEQTGEMPTLSAQVMTAEAGGSPIELTSLGRQVFTKIVDGVLIGYVMGKGEPDVLGDFLVDPENPMFVPIPDGDFSEGSETTVFRVSLNDNSKGNYTFELLQPLDHAPPVEVPASENTIALSFRFIATDSDGDQVGGVFTVNVKDDVPTVGDGETSTGQTAFVEDEAVNNGNDENTDFENNGESDLSESVTASLRVNWGSDRGDDAFESDEGNEIFRVGDRNVRFTDSSVGVNGSYLTETGTPPSEVVIENGEPVVVDGDAPVVGVLTSLGQKVSTALINGILVGYIGEVEPTLLAQPNPEYTAVNSDGPSLPSFTPADSIVFFVQLNDNEQGNYTFTLVRPLDHAAGENENTLNLTFKFTATDSDGDTVSSTFTVNVKDDVPTAGMADLGTADEDGLVPLRGNPFGPGDTTQVDGRYARGSLNISWGSDDANAVVDDGNADNQPGDRSIVFADTAIQKLLDLELTSEADALEYTLSSDGTMISATAGGRDIFTVKISDLENGKFEFKLLGTLDHGRDQEGANFEDNLNITFDIVATDSDGDDVKSSFTVSVDDDTPLIVLPLDSTVDEDGPLPVITGLPGSLPGGPGDNFLAITKAVGTLGISWGADDANPTSGTGYTLGDRAVVFTQANIAALSARNLTSDGETIQYELTNNDTAMKAFIMKGEARVEVFSVELSDRGIGYYEFNLYNNLDHPVPNTEDNLKFDFEFRVFDADGDNKTGSFSVSVDDDSPVILGATNSAVDEDGPLPVITGLPGSIPGGPNDNIIAITKSAGLLGILWGADSNNPTTGTAYKVGDRAVIFAQKTIDDLEAKGLTSDGLEVQYKLNEAGTQLDAYIVRDGNDVSVFTVKLSDQGVGSYEFELLNNLDHVQGESPEGSASDENNIGLTFTYTAIDSDGDAVTNDFSVSVDDDSPLIVLPLDSTVDEDGPLPIITGLPGGNPGGPGDDTDGPFPLPVPGQPTVINTLGIIWGADNNNPTSGTGYTVGDRAVIFTQETIDALKLERPGLKSDNFAVDYRLEAEGTRLVAFVKPTATTERLVFTVDLSDAGPLDAGTYTFVLRNNLDHPVNSTEDNLDFTFKFTAIDSDGDSRTAYFKVSVDDDTPLILLPLNSTVDEDGPVPVLTGLPGSNSGGSGDEPLALTVATNTLGISWGADNNNPTTGTGPGQGDRAVIFTQATIDALKDQHPDIKSDGQAVDYRLEDGGTKLVAFIGSGASAVTVFTVTLSDQGLLDAGSYTFTLQNNLDHPINPGEDELTFSFQFTAIDSDGDRVSSSFAVTVDDDTPIVFNPLNLSTTGNVDEDGPTAIPIIRPNPPQGLPNDNPGGAGDDDGATPSVTQGLYLSWGADNNNPTSGNAYVQGDRALTFISSIISDLEGQSIKSGDGVPLKYILNASGTQLVAYTGPTVTDIAQATEQIFRITLSDRDAGSYTFNLLGPIDHPAGNNENNLDITFGFRATDSDGDSLTGSFKVNVDDDTPTVPTNFLGSPTRVEASFTDDEAVGIQTANTGNGGSSDVFGQPGIATGGAGALFSIGADGFRAVSLTSVTPFQAVFKDANGFAETKTVAFGAGVFDSSNRVTTFTAQTSETTPRIAATLVIRTDGSYTFTQIAPLVHGTNSSTSEDDLNIDIAYLVTDKDGDTASNTLRVRVDDDAPIANTVTGSTTDDEARTLPFPGNTGGASGDTPNGSSISGTNLFSVGADGLRTVELTSKPTGQMAIYKNASGLPVQETVTWDNGVKGTNGETTFTASGTVGGSAATLVIKADGSYTFTQIRPFVHPTSGTAEEDLTLSFGYRITDGDGDQATGTLTVTVDDDTPTAGQVLNASLVSEDALGGDSAAFGFSTALATATGNIIGAGGLAFGADGPGAINLVAANQPTVSSNGQAVKYVVAGGVLYGYVGADVAANTVPSVTNQVFTLAIAAGIYTFTLLQAIDHTPNDQQSMLTLPFVINVADGDADATTATLNVTVEDGWDGNDVVTGTAAGEKLVGGPGNDTLNGGDGNDTLIGGAGADQLNGGNDDDTFVLEQDVVGSGTRGITLGDGSVVQVSIDGLAGTSDTVNGGGGFDTITLKAGSAPGYVWDTRAAPGFVSGVESITGTEGNDVIIFADTYSTSVSIEGGDGNDVLGSGAADDVINGGDGNDLISGLGGKDTVDGGKGNDTIWGGAGDDTMRGGEGNDLFLHAIGNGNDIIDGGSETGSSNPDYDILRILGDSSAQTINLAGITGGTEIVPATDARDISITYGSTSIRADEIERVEVIAGSGGITLNVGDVSGTAISTSTIVLEGAAGNDILDLSGFVGTQKVIFNDSDVVTSGDSDNVKLAGKWDDYSISLSNGVYTFVKNGVTVLETKNVETFTFMGEGNGGVTIDTTQLLSQPPTANPDVNGSDTVVEAGVGPGNTAVAGDSSAAGNALTNDTDPNAPVDDKTVVGLAVGSASGHVSGNVGGAGLKGTYGTLVLNANGEWTYTLDNADTDTNQLAKDAVVTDVFSYTMQDAAGNKSTSTVTVTINGTNDRPTDLSFTTLQVAENASNGTAVGTATGVDPDTGATFTYALQDNAGGRFAINASSGAITVASGAQLDFETNASHQVTVRVTDQFGATYDEQVTINVTDVNEAPTNLVVTQTQTSVAENTAIAAGAVVGTFSYSDDALGTETVTLTGADAALFQVVGNQIRWASGVTPDFETKSSYSFSLQINDPTVGATPDLSQTITINVTDVNEAPTNLVVTQTQTSVAENTAIAAGAVVGTFSYSDDALGTETVTLTGADAALFQVVGNQIRWASGVTPDFETKSSYSFSLQINDPTVGATPDLSQTITINVTDVNEAVSPTVISPPSYYAFADSRSPNTIDVNFGDLFTGETSQTTYTLSEITPNGGGGAGSLGGEWNWASYKANSLGLQASASAIEDNDKDVYIAKLVATTPGAAPTTTYFAMGIIGNDGELRVVTSSNSANTADNSDGDVVRLDAGNYGTVETGGGDDVVFGNTSADRSVRGEDGNDALYGNSGNDVLDGGNDSDFISGGAGNDTLIGEDGADYMIGGSGNDAFRYTDTDEGGDRIVDFSSGDVLEFDEDEFGGGLAVGNNDTGTLDTFHFRSGAGAATQNFSGQNQTMFIFDTTTSQVWYDSDGGSTNNRTLIATLENGGTITASQIRIIE